MDQQGNTIVTEIVETPSSAPPGFASALKHRNFALLWCGQTLSAVGNQMFPIALAIFVLNRHSSATDLGFVLAVQAFAVAAGSLIPAAVGDRWRRTRVLIAADLLRALAVIGLAASSHTIPSLVVGIMVLLVGIGEGLFQPVFGAVVPRVLPPELFQAGNGLVALSLNLATVVGPALAGLVVAVKGPALALWIDAATFIFSIATLAAIAEAPLSVGVREWAPGVRNAIRQMAADFREGIHAVLGRPWITVTIGVATVVMVLVTAPSLVILPIEARQRFGGASSYGWILAAMGVGSAVGSFIAGKIRTRWPGLVAVCGTLTIAGCVSALALLPLGGVVAAWAVGGAGVALFQVFWTTGVQRDVPESVLARVMALNWLLVLGLMPLGYSLTGIAVQSIGTRNLLLGGAVLTLVVGPLPLLTKGGAKFSSQEI
jgi:MFS family permease